MADIIELIYADHDWFRRQFFLLDDCRSADELAAVWGPLATRLDTHAQAEEEIFYPVLLELGRADRTDGDAEDETDDAIGDHNEIRDAVRAAREHEVGSEGWHAAVTKAREENGEHLEEEEREGLADFVAGATLQQRHDLAMQWLAFYAAHPAGRGVDDSDKDPNAYVEEHG